MLPIDNELIRTQTKSRNVRNRREVSDSERIMNYELRMMNAAEIMSVVTPSDLIIRCFYHSQFVIHNLTKPLAHHQVFTACGIFIKPFTALDSQVACCDHVHQQRAGSIFRVAETIV